MRNQKTRVYTITCNKCGDEIYSRSTHDYRSCSCHAIAIDGGRDYTKISFTPDVGPPKTRMRYVKATKKQLFDDWNNRTDKLGKFVSPR